MTQSSALERLKKGLALGLFVGVTVFIVKTNTACDKKTDETTEACCDTNNDSVETKAEVATQRKREPVDYNTAVDVGAKNAATFDASNKGNKGSEPAFFGASKAAPMPTFKLKTSDDLGGGKIKPFQGTRPSLGVGTP